MTILKYLVLICLSAAAYLHAQDTVAGEAARMSASGTEPQSSATLEFAAPKSVEDLAPSPMVVGRFDCGNDGTIYTFIDGYALNDGATPHDRVALLGIHPTGSVTNFPLHSVPGYDTSQPISSFAGNGHVYVLVHGRPKSAEQDGIAPLSLILVFDTDGSLTKTVAVSQDLNPLVLGVFPSGHFLLASEDRLNRRMALHLLDSGGHTLREIRMNDSDFLVRAAQLPAALRGPANYSPFLLISMSKFFPSGDNLLLVPLETYGLPIVELSERGILSSTIPQLPNNTVLEGFISSNASDFKMRLATFIDNDKEVFDSDGKVLGIATRPSTQIVQISRADGRILREVEIGGSGIRPACETDGTYRFLTAGAGQGSLQIVSAKIR
jgi:hypothetical protein